MITRRAFLTKTALLFAAMKLPAAAYAGVPAEDYVHKLGLDVIGLANGGRRGDKALQRRFAGLFTRYINIPGVANFALGLARKDLPPGDKAMFYDLVSNYAAALFVWYVEDFQGSDMKISGSSEQGKFITVDSAIVGSGEKLRWRVTGDAAGFRISDLNVKGVWLGIAMKKLFEDTLHKSKGDFHAIYDKLREAETW
jgi:phospholipid transport system substrate-binding protein